MTTEEEIEEIDRRNFRLVFLASFYMGDWDGLRSRIDRFVNYDHLKFLKMIIECCCMDLFYQVPPDILQMAFNKRREIREKELKTGRDFPPYKKSFFDQMIYDVCELKEAEDLYWIWIGLPIFNLLLQEHEIMFPPSAALKSDGFEESKRDYLFQTIWADSEFFHYFSKKFFENHEDLLHSVQSVDDLRGRNDLADVLHLWERTELVMLYHKTDSLPLLHYAMKHGYPFIIVWLISKLYPYQIRQRDCHGCIPLHYSFRDYVKSSFDEYSLYHVRFYKRIHIGSYALYEDSHCNLIAESKYTVPSYLFESYPEGAVLSDCVGKLPLHMFLEKIRDGWRKNDGNTERFCTAFMNRLIEEGPKALEIRDMVTRLYPFMIPSMKSDEREEEESAAAAAAAAAVDDDDERNNRLLLASTYDLLRQNPAVLISFIDPHKSLESYRLRSLRTDVVNLRHAVKNLQTKLSVANEINMKQQDEIIKLREENKRLRLVEASSTTVEKRSNGKRQY